MTSIVSEENVVRIPAEMAAEYGIVPGTMLEWLPAPSGDAFLVKVVADYAALAAALQGAGRKYLKPGQDAIRDLLEEREEADRQSSL